MNCALRKIIVRVIINWIDRSIDNRHHITHTSRTAAVTGNMPPYNTSAILYMLSKRQIKIKIKTYCMLNRLSMG